MENSKTHSFILQSRMNRFRHLSEFVNTVGIIIARGIWKFFAKVMIGKKDQEMKPWE